MSQEYGQEPRTLSPDEPCLVVGVGASAGGLDAFSQFLRALPEKSGLAFVLLQHLSPEHKSVITELLRKHSAMPVSEIEDGGKLRADHVYVAPPGKLVSVNDSRLYLKGLARKHGLQLPIDDFMISLADDLAERAVGVILSGSGSDGSAGVKAIKEVGGLVLVEDPDTATYRGMPQSAVGTAMADFVLPIPKLATQLLAYARQPMVKHSDPHKGIHGLNPKEMLRIIEVLRAETGYDFHSYKKPTLSRRIQRRMGLRGLSKTEDYLDLLKQDRSETEMLFRDMLIGVTSFFRDPEAFAELRRLVLRPLLKTSDESEAIRIWVPGCFTGEEAYSIAILLHEEAAHQNRTLHAQVFATDIDEAAIERARSGRYSANIAHEMPDSHLLLRYFDEDDAGYRVKKFLRESITFATQNLVSDPPFSRLHLVSCRNVLIYMEAALQNQVIRLFQYSLLPNGYIFLGSAESNSRHSENFRPLSKQSRIYQRLPNSTVSPSGLDGSATPAGFGAAGRQTQAAAPENPGTLFSAADTAREALLQNFAPPAVLINRFFEVLYLQGESSLYLAHPEGEPTYDLCAIAARGLKTRVRAAVQKARKSGSGARVRAPRVDRRDGKRVALDVAVNPVEKSGEETMFLVSFLELGAAPEIVEPANAPGMDDSELSSQLEYELYVTRQDLQNTIEQLETSNEELKASNEEVISMNEELQSSNEELETSREELQSLNEELNTVNNQLEENLSELESANNDLSNLLASTDTATIFLDTRLRIRRFNLAAHKLVHLIESDVGRPLSDLALNFEDPPLIKDAREVLDQLRPSEKQVFAADGSAYLRRITLYRTEQQRIEGVVLTLTNISDITRTVQLLRSREQQQATIARFGQKALVERNLNTLFDEAMRWTAEALDVELCKILEKRGEELFLRAGVGWQPGTVGNTRIPADTSQGGYALSSHEPVIVDDLARETRFAPPDLLKEHQVRSGISVVIGPYDDPWGVLCAHTREHRQFTSRDAAFLQSLANIIWAAVDNQARTEWLGLALTSASLTAAWIDPYHDDILYYGPAQEREAEKHTSVSRFLQMVHEDDRERLQESWDSAIQGRGTFMLEYRSNGAEPRWFRHWGQYVDVQGQARVAGITMDVTREKEYSEHLEHARHAADASNQAKSSFLANISHEIRTPLTAILGYVDLMQLEVPQEGSKADYLQRIRINGQNLLDIINDVLDLSRVEADRLQIRQEPFDTRTLLAELMSLMHLRASEKNLNFSIDVEGRVPEVIHTDMGRLKQVLLNLVSNAVKFTSQGTVRLRVFCNDDREDCRLTFQVIDTGIGIDRRQLDKIFDPFEQAELSSARSYGGTGLGLTISKRIADLLGAELSVDSEVDKGSTFTLVLPLGCTRDLDYIDIDEVDALVNTRSTPRINSRQLEGARILVVDDIDDVLTLIQQMLKRAGATVLTASNGREAIERIEFCDGEGTPVDAVLMDTMMPVMDGFTAVKHLRDHGFSNSIIALTAAAMTTDRERCLQAGCDDYLSKPISIEKLLAMLQQHLPHLGKAAAIPDGARVLIVEDNRDAGEAISTLLEMGGYDCHLALSGESAIDQARRCEPDVVLLDLTLPDMQGRQVAARLRQLPGGQRMRLLVLSGQDLDAQRSELKEAGFEGFLHKPVGRDLLARYFPALAETVE